MAFSASEEKRMTPQPSSFPPGSRPEAGDPGLAPALQASQQVQREHLLTIFEHVPAGIVYLDPRGHILAVNPAFERYVSRPSEALVGRRLADAFPTGGASLQLLIEEVGRTGGTVSQQSGRFSWGSSSD